MHQNKVHIKMEAKYAALHTGIQYIYGDIQENIDKRAKMYN